MLDNVQKPDILSPLQSFYRKAGCLVRFEHLGSGGVAHVAEVAAARAPVYC
jgi:hypothetical protein